MQSTWLSSGNNKNEGFLGGGRPKRIYLQSRRYKGKTQKKVFQKTSHDNKHASPMYFWASDEPENWLSLTASTKAQEIPSESFSSDHF